ncbi:MAG: 16S rRNA (cytosine(1402)-N(4))-methyltransferase RsmH [Clostridiales bacterium]|nr:16S rRNA (cytosine(1402)-N(4))-methyltransferase RsmH [Clostridiales bacterium]
MEFEHISVLLNETVDALEVKEGGLYLDGTLGGGGHSQAILERGGRVIGIDRDPNAIQAASERLKAYGDRFRAVRGNFHDVKMLIDEELDGAVLDLGVSSHQLDVRERGFSYHDNAPLDMRMDTDAPLTAANIVNEWSESEIARVIRDFGEENWAVQIARVICDRRKQAPIETTAQLVAIIDAAIPKKFRAKEGGAHPARRTFQALRIAVNDELDPLKDALFDIMDMLKTEGRLSVIAFHSLEDRIVKTAFRTMADPCTCPKNMPICVCGKKPVANIITRKPITASEEELTANPRARSATLRVAEKI